MGSLVAQRGVFCALRSSWYVSLAEALRLVKSILGLGYGCQVVRRPRVRRRPLFAPIGLPTKVFTRRPCSREHPFQKLSSRLTRSAPAYRLTSGTNTRCNGSAPRRRAKSDLSQKHTVLYGNGNQWPGG